MGLATLESVSFPLGKIVTGVEATWFRGGSPGGASSGTGVRRLGIFFPFPRTGFICLSRVGGRMDVVSYLSDERKFVV